MMDWDSSHREQAILAELEPLLRGHRVASSLPCFDTALEHFDVGKAFLPVFGCLTDSASFGGSRSIKNDFLGLR